MAELLDRQPLAEALAGTLRPLPYARTLPAACYTDAGIFQLECSALFSGSWLAVAREHDVRDVGGFVTRDIAGERVLVVRGQDTVLRAFYNVCRHRGSRLVEEACGRLRAAIVCPYHAWAYGLDGVLKHARGMGAAGRAAAGNLATLPLAVEHGFVWVNLDARTGALADALHDLPDLSRFGLQRLQRAASLDYRLDANWKLVCENYSECYHCPRAHPQLDRLSALSAGGFESGACYNGGPMRIRLEFDTLSTTGRSTWPRLAPAPPPGSPLVHYYLIYPNLMLGIHPDYLSVHSVWPIAAAESRVRCEILVAPDALAMPGFDASEVIDFWDLTNRQDWALIEGAQRGIGSRGYRPGPYHAAERCVHAFDRWYGAWLLGAWAGS